MNIEPAPPPPADPCPECRGGKCRNCTYEVPANVEGDVWTICPCSAAGHEVTP